MRKMKDSGVEWIGEIPSDWTICKILYVLKMPLTDGPHTTPEMFDDGVPFVSAEAVSCGNGRIDFDHIRGYISEEFYQECCKKYIPQINDIYMIKSGATTGKVAIVDTDRKFTIWSPLAVFRSNEKKVKSKYMFYYLQSSGFQKQVELSWSFGTQQNIGMRALERLSISVPPLLEQKKIADFLDEKCGEIDSIKADVQRQIELLNDYKKSVITEAVTKGLNPKAKLKDSGIEWIGKIPEHWLTKKIKYLTSQPLQYGANESGCDYDDSLPRYIRITDISMDNKLKDDGKLSLEFDKAKPYLLEDDDLLFARSGASVGKTFLYKKEYGKSAFAGYLIKASIDKTKAYPKFVYYNTLSNCYDSWKQQVFTQATIQNIGAEKYNTFVIPVPPLSEQKEIADYLDEKCSEIDSVIADKQKQLETLDEYKKSLIFEYVTGKKECV